MMPNHIGHGHAHAHCWAHLIKIILATIQNNEYGSAFSNHNNDQGAHFWNKHNGTRLICYVSFRPGCMLNLHQSTTPRRSPSCIDFVIVFTSWTSEGGTYHKVTRSNFVSTIGVLWNWPKQCSAVLPGLNCLRVMHRVGISAKNPGGIYGVYPGKNYPLNVP